MMVEQKSHLHRIFDIENENGTFFRKGRGYKGRGERGIEKEDSLAGTCFHGDR